MNMRQWPAAIGAGVADLAGALLKGLKSKAGVQLMLLLGGSGIIAAFGAVLVYILGWKLADGAPEPVLIEIVRWLGIAAVVCIAGLVICVWFAAGRGPDKISVSTAAGSLELDMVGGDKPAEITVDQVT